MTSAKIFKWERKTDEHGGVARGKEIVHTSVHIDSDHKEKERPNGQRLNGEATNKWGGGRRSAAQKRTSTGEVR